MKGLLWVHPTFIYHGNRCSGRRCEWCFINGVAVSGRSCFVWGIIKWGEVCEIEKSSGRKESESESVVFWEQSTVSKVDLCGVCCERVSWSVQNVRGGFILVVLVCLDRWVYYRVGMSLSVEHVLAIIVQ